MTVTIEDILLEAQKRLYQVGILNSYREARLLLKYALNFSLEQIIASPELQLTSEQAEKYENWLLRRISHEPLSKIREEKEFWSLPFIVKAETLDPRPDSEVLIEAVLKIYPVRETSFKILEFGIGTGCLIMSLLHEYPYSSGVGIDKSIDALGVANLNLERFKLQDRLKLVHASWGDGIEEPFDIIISNPPYIAEKERHTLALDVLQYDPQIALFGGEDGLDAYRDLAPHAARLLKTSGHFFIEIGQGQENAVEKIFEELGLLIQEWIPDLSGIIRCGIFQKISE